MTSRLRRAVAALTAGLLVLGGLTSCSPEIKGVTGLAVDATGRPLAVLAWCAERPPDVVLLFLDEPDDEPASTSTWDWPGHEYAVPDTATSPATVPLPDFPPPDLARDLTYRMYGVADDNDFTSHAVTFQLDDLVGLAPGSVLITAQVRGAEVPRSLTLDEFARWGSEEC